MFTPRPTPAARSTARLRHSRLLAATLFLGLSSGSLAACSAPTAAPPDASAPAPLPEEASAVRLTTEVTRVAGDLAPGRRRQTAARTGAVVQRFVEAAFLGDYPRPGFDKAFTGFTSGARTLAVKDRAVLTGRTFAEADEVTVGAAAAYVSVVAPRGRAVGATARLSLDLEVTSGEVTTPVQVRGRLLLTPAAGRWRIFGYDLSRSDTGGAMARGRS